MALVWNYVKKLSDKTVIDEFENKYSFKLDKELKQCILKYNGGSPNIYSFSLKNKNLDKVFGNMVSFNVNDKESIYQLLGKIKVLYENNKLVYVPFGVDPFGNYICQKNNGAIYFLYSETNEYFEICNGFKSFLEGLH